MDQRISPDIFEGKPQEVEYDVYMMKMRALEKHIKVQREKK